MRILHCIMLLVLLFPAANVFSQSLFTGKYSMIVLDNKDSAKFVQYKNIVEKTDGHAIHCYPPTIIQGYLTKDGEKMLRSQSKVIAVTDTFYDAKGSFSFRDKMVINVWNQKFLAMMATRGEEDKSGDNDRAEEKPGKYETSEYMMGSVAVAVVFVESDGTLEKKTERWDDYSKEDMFYQVRKGLEWWAEQGGYRASLSWTYEFMDVKTKYEPITHSYKDADVWINDVAIKLGYGEGDSYRICNEFANDLRNKYKTNWAFVVLAVPADNDDDGNWKESGSVAWANLGGPLLVMNNRCDGWGPDQAWEVMAHETGHIFNALDEYAGASNANERNGLLGVINGNALDGGLINEECIMKAHGLRACDFTKGQIGWIDDNDDGIYIVDYLNLSKNFNQKMVAREALNLKGKSRFKIDYMDPRIEKSRKFYTDDFSMNSRGWKEDKFSYVRNGAYSLNGSSASPIWLPDTYGDANIAVTTKWESGSNTESYGLDVYSMNSGDFFNIYINHDGEYSVNHVKAGEAYYLNWTKSPVIKGESTNILKVKCLKNKISFYINDQLIKTFEDPIAGDRSIGLAVGYDVRVLFDDLTITKP
ncbi:hypothetical protein F9K33_11490 [bacterium]|nr:MAG: hypothetical protein F9K33_11490 [bacterium]